MDQFIYESRLICASRLNTVTSVVDVSPGARGACKINWDTAVKIICINGIEDPYSCLGLKRAKYKINIPTMEGSIIASMIRKKRKLLIYGTFHSSPMSSRDTSDRFLCMRNRKIRI